MDGIIIINKEKNYTSHDVVNKVKKMLNTKVGHTGTLDPNAIGVLPLLLGNATKISKYLVEHDKIYEVTLQLGKKTTTADVEGEIIEQKEVGNLKSESVEKVLKSFVGKQEQIPPIYSAIKVKGKKLYEYARNGETVTLAPRKIEIYSIDMNSIDNDKKKLKFTVSCSKGTYIRSLCEDIAEKMGTVGYMEDLNRTKVGRFKIEDAVTLSELEEKLQNMEFIKTKIKSIENTFLDKPEIEVEEKRLPHFLNGVKITERVEDGLYRIYSKGEFIGLGIVKDELLKRDVII